MKPALDGLTPQTIATAEEPVRDQELRPRAVDVPPVAFGLSAAAGVLMIVASVWSVLVPGLYTDRAWVREALRGGDLVTLLLAAPLLVASTRLARQGSARAQVLWLGMLGYGIYNYAYYVFGSQFNDVFALHIAIFSMSVFALATALPGLDVSGIASEFRTTRATRWVGAFLILTGVGQGGLWLFLVIRFAVTGELLHDIPVAGQHLVFALDLSLLVPALIGAGILLVRRNVVGFVLGLAVSLFGLVYQVNLNMAALFQANANVPGVKAFPLEGVVLIVGMAVAAGILWRARVWPVGGRTKDLPLSAKERASIGAST